MRNDPANCCQSFPRVPAELSDANRKRYDRLQFYQSSNARPFGRCAVFLSLLFTVGCRSTRDNQIDILERELRAQEDYIYELEDYVVEYSDKLRQCRCSQPHVAAVTKPTPAPKQPTRSIAKPSTVERKPATSTRTLQEPVEQSPLPDRTPETPIEDLQVPEIELEIGEPIGSDEEVEATQLAQAEEGPSAKVQYEPQSESLHIPDPADYQVASYDESESIFADSEEAIEFPFEEESVEEIEELEKSETHVVEESPKPSGARQSGS